MHTRLRETARNLRSTSCAASGVFVRGILVGGFVVCSAACGRPADSVAPAASATSAPPAASAAAFGEKITASLVPLAEIAAHPSRFQNDVVATSGKVTAVCQERGCWMELADSTGQAHVRMHGHSFFVPRTAPGHTARVQARLVPAQGGGMDCEGQAHAAGAACENDGKDPSGTARVELDATGVEID